MDEHTKADEVRKIRIKLNDKNGRNGPNRQSMARSVVTAGGINRSTSQPNMTTRGGKNSSAIVENNASLQAQPKSNANP